MLNANGATVIDVAEHNTNTRWATKIDSRFVLTDTRTDLQFAHMHLMHELELLRKDIQIFALRTTLRVGVIMVVTCSVFFFAMKLT